MNMIRPIPQHLTMVPFNAKLIAWHTSLDVAAWDADDEYDVLIINGQQYRHSQPVQFIVALAGMSIRKAKATLHAFQWERAQVAA